MNKLHWVCRPKTSFCLALLVLIPVHLIHIGGSAWLASSPKPDGDGPDYENIAFHLYSQQEYRFDNSNPDWRSLYTDRKIVSDPTEPEPYAAHLDAPQRNLLATGRPPLLPTLLAGLYHLFGRNEVAFRALLLWLALSIAVSGALAVALTAALWQRNLMQRDPGPSLVRCQIAGLIAIVATITLAATQRTLKGYAEDFLTEPLALLLLQLFVLSILKVESSHSLPLPLKPPSVSTPSSVPKRWLAFSGVLFALAILTRSVFVLWLPGIVFFLWISMREPSDATHRRKVLVNLSIFVATCLLICAPWWIRNIRALDNFMPLGTQGPITLLGGYCDDALVAGGDWQFGPEQALRLELSTEPTWLAAKDDTHREVLVAQAASREVRTWVSNHWTELPGLAWARIVTHWNPYAGRSLVWKLLILIGGAWLLRQPGTGRIWLIGLPVLSTVVTALLYSTGGRFLVPLYGILFTLAGLGVGWLAQQILMISAAHAKHRNSPH